MPRRIYTYEPGRGWDTLNFIITIGAFIQAIAILVFLANLVISYFKGARAGNDPWDAWTLEWSTVRRRQPITLRRFRQSRAAAPCGT